MIKAFKSLPQSKRQNAFDGLVQRAIASRLGAIRTRFHLYFPRPPRSKLSLFVRRNATEGSIAGGGCGANGKRGRGRRFTGQLFSDGKQSSVQLTRIGEDS
jgi:hypothetical protein